MNAKKTTKITIERLITQKEIDQISEILKIPVGITFSIRGYGSVGASTQYVILNNYESYSTNQYMLETVTTREENI